MGALARFQFGDASLELLLARQQHRQRHEERDQAEELLVHGDLPSRGRERWLARGRDCMTFVVQRADR
jgi:hypothetical protein